MPQHLSVYYLFNSIFFHEPFKYTQVQWFLASSSKVVIPSILGISIPGTALLYNLKTGTTMSLFRADFHTLSYTFTLETNIHKWTSNSVFETPWSIMQTYCLCDAFLKQSSEFSLGWARRGAAHAVSWMLLGVGAPTAWTCSEATGLGGPLSWENATSHGFRWAALLCKYLQQETFLWLQENNFWSMTYKILNMSMFTFKTPL